MAWWHHRRAPLERKHAEVALKVPGSNLLRHACSLSLALVSLGCGSDSDAKGSRDAGGNKSPLDGDHQHDTRNDAAAEDDEVDNNEQDSGGPTDTVGDGDSEPGDSLGACTKDSHEPDDTLAKVEAGKPINGIKPIEIKGRTACAQDTDLIWAGPVDNGAKASAELTWDATDGALELSLLDADGDPITYLDVSKKQSGRSEVGVDVFYGGATNAENDDRGDNYFYVRVHNPGKASVQYTLKVTAQVFGP
jgi:hypothetical protein